ncbi:MAG: uracil-DNA glycosylase [Clostridiales bacterium]|nr:uracil-DNA glycosylase [Clostridiales bacterium]
MGKKELDETIKKFIEKAYPDQSGQMVLGEGKTLRPLMMLIGEAPGAQEVVEKKPFVGKAGKNLDVFLKEIHLSREELYVTNAVKFRPTKQGKRTLVNRTPTRKEIKDFVPYLHEEIDLIQPRTVVTLGNSPLYALTGEGNIGECHGIPVKITIDNKKYPLFPLYHPAAIIYNQALKAVYQEDVEKLFRWLSL